MKRKRFLVNGMENGLTRKNPILPQWRIFHSPTETQHTETKKKLDEKAWREWKIYSRNEKHTFLCL